MISSTQSATPRQSSSYVDKTKDNQEVPRSVPQPSQQTQASMSPTPSQTVTMTETVTVALNANTDKGTAIPPPPLLGADDAEKPGFNRAQNVTNVERSPIPPSQPALKGSSPPVVNVWDMRKERMAQARPSSNTTSPNPTTQAPPVISAPNSSRITSASSQNSPASLSTSSITPTTASRTPQSASKPVMTRASLLINGSHYSSDDDAFTVRPRQAPPLNVSDWPEVGKSTHLPSASTPQLKSVEAKPTADHVEPGSGNGSKKSDKPKWIPIPAQELQEAADAARRSNLPPRSVNRNSQNPGRNDGTNSNIGSQNRPRHYVRDRQPASLVSSASHSQSQSRTGSVHSSPRQGSSRRSRQLPEDIRPSEASTERDTRSSLNNSPQLVSHPHPQIVNNSISGPPYPDTHSVSPYNPPSAPPSSHSQPTSYQPTRVTNSPSVIPYSPVPGMYAPSPMPYHHLMYGGVPPYPPYPPYGYGYPDPYSMYWAAPPPGPMPHDPYAASMSPQSQSSIPGVPPLTAMTHPPPPSESEPVIGYREMELPVFNLPGGSTEDGGPGSRSTLNFGTIDISSSSPPSATSTVTPTSGIIAGPAMLSSTLSSPYDNTVAEVERAFTTFTIGVGPGDAGPSRRVTGVEGSEPFNEVKVVDLTDVETKIEFGTVSRVSDNVETLADLSSNRSSLQVEISINDRQGSRLSPIALDLSASGLPAMPAPTSTSALYAPPGPLSVQHEAGLGHGDPDGYGGRRRRGGFVGSGYERGGYGGRGGRGGFSGPGFRKRGSPRGGYQNQGSRIRYPPSQQAMPPPDSTVYYALPPPAPMATTTYIPTGFDGYPAYLPYPPIPAPPPPPPAQPRVPVPAPITELPFPLDPTRHYLLGQLEYYISAQNLAQDLYLRQQMDSEGWIPISLLASFNRVKVLTHDTDVVKHVLGFSSLVQLKDEWARPHNWAQFVLPGATKSVVDGSSLRMTAEPHPEGAYEHPHPPPTFQPVGYPGPQGEAYAPEALHAEVNPDVGETASPSTRDEDDAESVGHEEDDDDDEIEFVYDQETAKLMS